MRTYSVVYTTTASTVVTVEAQNETEARTKAGEVFAPPNLCHQCSGSTYDNGENSGVELGDWEPLEQDGVWEV